MSVESSLSREVDVSFFDHKVLFFYHYGSYKSPCWRLGSVPLRQQDSLPSRLCGMLLGPSLPTPQGTLLWGHVRKDTAIHTIMTIKFTSSLPWSEHQVCRSCCDEVHRSTWQSSWLQGNWWKTGQEEGEGEAKQARLASHFHPQVVAQLEHMPQQPNVSLQTKIGSECWASP